MDSWTAGDFPSPLMRFLLCLGIEPEVCPPRRPDLNAFVERLHKSYEEEAIQVYLPTTLLEVQDMNLDFRRHYNYQRPNQALTCRNQPPRRAFPDLPPLPPLPKMVDPTRWLDHLHGQTFKRRVELPLPSAGIPSREKLAGAYRSVWYHTSWLASKIRPIQALMATVWYSLPRG